MSGILSQRFTCQTATRAGLPVRVKRRTKSPVFFVEARGRPVSRLVSLAPQNMEGVARQVTQPFVLCARVPLENTGAPLGAPPGQARAVRADLRAFSFRQRAVLFVGRSSVNGRPSASSWRAALIGRQTGSRCRTGTCLRGTQRGRRILLHHQTPLDDAPR